MEIGTIEELSEVENSESKELNKSLLSKIISLDNSIENIKLEKENK